MSEELVREEVVEVVDRAWKNCSLPRMCKRSPVDPIALAQRHLGMIVCLDRRQPQRSRPNARWTQANFPAAGTVRGAARWTVAHEIGEHFKADLLGRLGIGPEQTGDDVRRIAGQPVPHRLLVPTSSFRGALAHGL